MSVVIHLSLATNAKVTHVRYYVRLRYITVGTNLVWICLYFFEKKINEKKNKLLILSQLVHNS